MFLNLISLSAENVSFSAYFLNRRGKISIQFKNFLEPYTIEQPSVKNPQTTKPTTT